MMRLTDITIKNLPIPDKGQKVYGDDSLRGFGVRVSQGGSKTFVLTYGKRRKRVTLGQVGVVPLKKARNRARDILAEHQLNPDEAPSISFGNALDQFFKLHVERNNKPSTQRTTKHLLDHHFRPKLKDKMMRDITPHDIMKITDDLHNRPSAANHAFIAVHTFLRWALARRHISSDPLAGLKRPTKAESRSRVLTNDELTQVLKYALKRGTYGQIVTMLVYTGQRLGQISHLRREYIHDDLITWPAELMKGNKEHTIPIGPHTAQLLSTLPSEGYLFRGRGDNAYNGWSNGKRHFKVDIPHWTLHDLRRTFATGHARLGTPPHITERILAHQSGTISGVAAIYNRHSYLEEMRDVLTSWEQHLQQLMVL
jgi:integrase